MKTKQEQVEEIAQIICEYCDTDGKCWDNQICANVNIQDCRHKESAERLIQAGYGDVSEYKAEIEKLKEETSSIRKDTAKEFATCICEMLWNLGIDGSGNRFSYGDLTSKEVLYVAKQFGVDVDDHLCKENTIATSHISKLLEQDAEIKKLEQQVKQAKVDALNELKTHSYYDDDYMEGYVFVSDIDELIEEIEK